MGEDREKSDLDEFEPIPLAEPDPPEPAASTPKARVKTEKRPRSLHPAAETSPAAEPPPAAAAAAATVGKKLTPEEMIFCRKHPEAVGKWWCDTCKAPVCRECVEITEDRKARRPVARCKTCDQVCKLNKEARKLDEHDNSPFTARLARGLAYPFHGYNWVIFLMLSVVFTAPLLLGLAFPLVIWVFFPFVSIFLITWMFDVLGESARGNRDMPNLVLPVDFWVDLVRPVLLFACAWGVSFGPALLVTGYLPSALELPGYANTMIGPILLVGGHIILPVCLLLVTLYETPMSLRPSMIFHGINTMKIDYLILLVLFAMLPFVTSLAVLYPSVTNILIFGPVMLYLLAVCMHLLGQLYHAHRHNLGWLQ